MIEELRPLSQAFAFMFGIRPLRGLFSEPYPLAYSVTVTRTSNIGKRQTVVHFAHPETGAKGSVIRSRHEARLSSAVGSSFYVRCLSQHGKPVFDSAIE